MSATRYLTRSLAEAALTRGRGIEQMLSVTDEGEGRRIRWVTISSGPDADFVVRAHDVHDPGFSSFLDLNEFPPTDEDEFIGEGRLVAEHPEAEVALSAAEALGAVSDRWVNEGLIGDEYGDAINRS